MMEMEDARDALITRDGIAYFGYGHTTLFCKIIGVDPEHVMLMNENFFKEHSIIRLSKYSDDKWSFRDDMVRDGFITPEQLKVLEVWVDAGFLSDRSAFCVDRGICKELDAHQRIVYELREVFDTMSKERDSKYYY